MTGEQRDRGPGRTETSGRASRSATARPARRIESAAVATTRVRAGARSSTGSRGGLRTRGPSPLRLERDLWMTRGSNGAWSEATNSTLEQVLSGRDVRDRPSQRGGHRDERVVEVHVQVSLVRDHVERGGGNDLRTLQRHAEHDARAVHHLAVRRREDRELRRLEASVPRSRSARSVRRVEPPATAADQQRREAAESARPERRRTGPPRGGRLCVRRGHLISW